MQKALLFAVLSLAIVGCGQQQHQASTTAGASTAPTTAATMPDNWHDAFRGKTLAESFPTVVASCRGNLETVEHTASGSHVLGWGFNSANSDGYAYILTTDANNVVNGYASTNAQRPDVGQTIPTVTSAHIGFDAWSTQRAGQITAWGVDAATHSACRLGSIAL